MPKILPDVQNRILTAAEHHFKDYGFEKADMRQIARDANIAIGTIYLNFKNKEELYLYVIKRGWRNTIDKINLISNQDDEPKRLLSQILQVLIHDLTDRKSIDSLWMEVGSIHHQKYGARKENDVLTNIHYQLSLPFSRVLKKIAGNNYAGFQPEIFDQLGKFAFMMALDVCTLKPDETTGSINLIIDLLSSYIEKPI